MFWTMFVASGFVVAALRAGVALYPKGQRAIVARSRSRIMVGDSCTVVAAIGQAFRCHAPRHRFWNRGKDSGIRNFILVAAAYAVENKEHTPNLVSSGESEGVAGTECVRMELLPN